MVMCSAHPHRLPDLTKYKLLIIQTAHLSPGLAWLEYDLPFRKDAAATGTSDWSQMNLDLYNFHLQTSPPVTTQHFSIFQPLPPLRSLLARATVPASHIASPTTMVDAGGLLGNAATVMFVVHAMGTNCRANCPFQPYREARSSSPSPSAALTKGEGSEEEHFSQLLVNSVHGIVPVDPEQEPERELSWPSLMWQMLTEMWPSIQGIGHSWE